MLNSRLNLANDAQIAANKMLDRSPRGSVSNFRNRVGGSSVNIGVPASQSHAHSSYDLGPRVALSHRSPWFVS